MPLLQGSLRLDHEDNTVRAEQRNISHNSLGKTDVLTNTDTRFEDYKHKQR